MALVVAAFCHAATKLAAWMQRRLELKTGIKLQLLFSLLPLLSYCLLLSMLLSLLLLSFSLLPLLAAAPRFLPFRSSRIPFVSDTQIQIHILLSHRDIDRYADREPDTQIQIHRSKNLIHILARCQ